MGQVEVLMSKAYYMECVVVSVWAEGRFVFAVTPGHGDQVRVCMDVCVCACVPLLSSSHFLTHTHSLYDPAAPPILTLPLTLLS